MKYFILYLYIIVHSIVYCHSVNNKQLLRVEPISTVQIDIAKRKDIFFQKRDISKNENHQPSLHSLQYDDNLRLSLKAFNNSIHLHLTPNYDLFHPNAVIHQDGISRKLNPSDYRVYRGFVVDQSFSDHWWISGLLDNEHKMNDQPGVLGWARILVRHDIKHNMDYPLIEGAFSFNNDIHHIKLKDNYHLTKRSDDASLLGDYSNIHMVIYRDSDTVTSNDGQHNNHCGFDKLKHPKVYNPLNLDSMSTTKFSVLDTTDNLFGASSHLSKRAPAGCPTSQKVLYMGAAADCTYVKYYQSPDNARTQIINDWNQVSSVYTSTFNVGLGLINITLMDATCPSTPPKATNWNQACSTGYSISTRLSDFSKWRGSLGNDGAGLWHLMTNCATGPEVGIAWLSQVCNIDAIYSSSTGEYTSGTGVSSIIRDEWKVIAHEIGHGFGAIHDCTSSTCPCSGSSCDCCPYSNSQCDAEGKYFMNPTSNATSSSFSPCSISTICSAMSAFSSCLEKPGTKTITTLQMCGNGIVESGEECDPGGKDTACCNAATCKFKTGAVCDDFNDHCCNNCQVRPANYTCRVSSGECDVVEVCDGVSGSCPEDKYKPDLTSCGTGGLQCASGQCTSRDAQCVARGTSYNIAKACSGDSSCMITCQYPGSAFSCIQFPGFFTDGTPCGIAGVCKDGKCNTDNAASNIKNWIDTHLQIFIPVVVIVGLLILSCLVRSCCYSRRTGYNNMNENTIVYTVPGQQQPAYYYPPPPPPTNNANQNYYTPPPQNTNWVDPSHYNGNPNNGPQQPLPVYSQHEPLHNSYELNQLQSSGNQYRGATSPTIPNSPSPYHNGHR